ncbi:hypothetical protein F5B21DRAFT_499781 [Xylaria acuta]|nr:hypothetical protein F5B21DRAFT_499781 [Xylaria acuta]
MHERNDRSEIISAHDTQITWSRDEGGKRLMLAALPQVLLAFLSITCTTPLLTASLFPQVSPPLPVSAEESAKINFVATEGSLWGTSHLYPVSLEVPVRAGARACGRGLTARAANKMALSLPKQAQSIHPLLVHAKRLAALSQSKLAQIVELLHPWHDFRQTTDSHKLHIREPAVTTSLNHPLIFELDVALLVLNGRGIDSLNGYESRSATTTGNQLITPEGRSSQAPNCLSL